MRLKKLKLAGFKSFVDPTTVPFPTQLTAVLGPNGCGKSNVIDAVRWVMGETSAKQLRGEAMADVIFNGCATRKPVGVAAVELVFDNSDGAIGGEYAQYSELSLKRQVSRDGQSIYLLNGARCRRKDITHIFLGTGLGPRSYSVIEQGMISRLIEAKPEEFRVHLEEAAGISKYKERRRETETRIRHTRENLERLNDIREELDKQIERLNRQAKAAIKYQEYRGEERLLKAQLLALRWTALDTQFREQDQLIKAQEIQLEATIAEQRHCDKEIEERRQYHIELTDHFNEAQRQYYQIGAEIARLEQAIQDHQERQQQLQLEREEARVQLQEANAHLSSDQQSLASTCLIIEEKQPEWEMAKINLQAQQDALMEVEDQKAIWQNGWDQFNSDSHESSKTAQVEQTRIQHLENQLQSLMRQKQQLQDEDSNFDEQASENAILEFATGEAESEAQITEKASQIEFTQQEIAELRQNLQERQAILSEKQNKLQQCRGRYSSLETLQQAALGKEKGNTQAWLSEHQLGEMPRLGEVMQVESGWEYAVETVLGRALQALCVSSVAEIAVTANSLQKGEISFFESGTVNPSNHSGLVTRLSEKVTTGIASIQARLQQIVYADDLNAARHLWPTLAEGESIVTRDGVWMGPGWMSIKRQQDPSDNGILAREAELKQLREEIATLESVIDDLKNQNSDCQEKMRSLEEYRDSASREQSDLQKTLSTWSTKRQVAENNLARMRERRSAIADKITELKLTVDGIEEELAGARAIWNDAMKLMDHNADRRELLINERDILSSQLEETRLAVSRTREEVHALAMVVQAQQTQKQGLEQSIQRSAERIRQLSTRHESIESALQTASDPAGEQRATLDEKLVMHANAEELLQSSRQALESADEELQGFESKRSNADQNARAIQNRLAQLRMDGQTYSVRRMTIEESIAETDFQLETLINEMPEEANEPGWEQILTDISARIQRLGPINLAAIEEFKTESERKSYLDAQYADLTTALETLEGAIHKIDKETRARFKETFDTVNSHFQALFPRLFGGGTAYLELTGEDLLDTGVAIIARPPGKRNSSIHLLSGGEKAMTAVALVFSIFQLNPSPFCLLDEVDAPLDDANVTRFCNMVREMSKNTQFIFITHNKVTMELADNLIGVTMQEPGVSRLVAVDIEEAMSMAEA